MTQAAAMGAALAGHVEALAARVAQLEHDTRQRDEEELAMVALVEALTARLEAVEKKLERLGLGHHQEIDRLKLEHIKLELRVGQCEEMTASLGPPPRLAEAPKSKNQIPNGG